MNIKAMLLFVCSLLLVIIPGAINQYHSLGLPAWDYMSWKMSAHVFPLIISAIIAALVCRYFFKKEITVSIIYSVLTFLCIMPISSTATEVFGSFLLGSFISLAKLKVKRRMFYLNPAVAARLLLFLLHIPIVHADAISSATPLAYCHILLDSGQRCHLPISQIIIGHWQGALGETSKLGILAGAMILMVFRLIKAQVMVFGLAGAIAGWLIVYFVLGYHSLPGLGSYLLMGSLLFGLVFMTTDLFTRLLSQQEYALYGFLVGFLCILLRVLTPFPEATLLSLVISQLLILLYTLFRRADRESVVLSRK